MRKKEADFRELSRRDRQILDVVIELEESTAREIHEHFALDVSYSTVRTFLTRLERQKLIQHRLDGKTYYYTAAPQIENKMATGLKHRLLKLKGSPVQAAAAFLADDPSRLSRSDIAYLRKILDQIEEKLEHDTKRTD